MTTLLTDKLQYLNYFDNLPHELIQLIDMYYNYHLRMDYTVAYIEDFKPDNGCMWLFDDFVCSKANVSFFLWLHQNPYQLELDLDWWDNGEKAAVEYEIVCPTLNKVWKSKWWQNNDNNFEFDEQILLYTLTDEDVAKFPLAFFARFETL